MISTEKKILDLVQNQSVSFIGSVDTDGYPNVKAMLQPRYTEGIKLFYYSTHLHNMRTQQFKSSPKACLYFYDPSTFAGVMLKGEMEVLEAQHYKDMLWQDGDTVFYPDGVEDADYCVLRFTATSWRYYKNLNTIIGTIE